MTSSPFPVRPIRTRDQLQNRLDQIAAEFTDILYPSFLYVGEDKTLLQALTHEVPGGRQLWPVPKRWRPEAEKVDAIIIDTDLDYDALQTLSDLTANVATIFCTHRTNDPIDVYSRAFPVLFLQRPSAQVLIPTILSLFKLNFASVYLNAQTPLISSNDDYLSAMTEIFSVASAGESMVITADDQSHLQMIHEWLTDTIDFPETVVVDDLTTHSATDTSSDTTLFVYDLDRKNARALTDCLSVNRDAQTIVFRSHGTETKNALPDEQFRNFKIPTLSDRPDDLATIAFYLAVVIAGNTPPVYLNEKQIRSLVRSSGKNASTTTLCAALRVAITDGTARSLTPVTPAPENILWDSLPLDTVNKTFENTLLTRMIDASNNRLVAAHSQINIQTLYARRRLYKKQIL